MPLRFNGAWRFTPPPDGAFRNSSIPTVALNECLDIIGKVAAQGDMQEVLEHFKGYFCTAVGTTHVWSSNASWAETDLRSYMEEAATNAPLFIEAMVEACRRVSRLGEHFYAPDATIINALLAKRAIGYEVCGDDLVMREGVSVVTTAIAVPEPPPTMAEQAAGILRECLGRSDQLLAEGRDREAVQEILWLLETVSTAFRGLDTTTGTIEGNYFNRIVKELRHSNAGTTLDCVLRWVEALHGYLSSPTGGGVRHGTDLWDGVALSPQDARLFCNLIRSYIAFLLVEHERLAKPIRPAS